MQLSVSQVHPNPYQPRQHFDTERLQELASSLKAQGLLQPIVVRRQQGGFELIAGERRWRAAQMAGFETIPALVKRAMMRKCWDWRCWRTAARNLNPLDEARAYQRLQTEFHLRQEDVHAMWVRTAPPLPMRCAAQTARGVAGRSRGRPTDHGACADAAGVGVRRGAAPAARADSCDWSLRAGTKRRCGPRNAPPRTVAPNQRTLLSSRRRYNATSVPRGDQARAEARQNRDHLHGRG